MCLKGVGKSKDGKSVSFQAEEGDVGEWALCPCSYTVLVTT